MTTSPRNPVLAAMLLSFLWFLSGNAAWADTPRPQLQRQSRPATGFSGCLTRAASDPARPAPIT